MVCATLNYIDLVLISASAITGCVSISIQEVKTPGLERQIKENQCFYKMFGVWQ